MLDYGALPPEINSARMYSGSGSAPLQAAASAWNGLAAELNSTAAGYQTAITRLSTEEWMGPASASMAQAVAPYVTWMNTTATQAEQAAMQARTAVAAYETAYAATVPPQLVAANRAQVAQLMANNLLGLNTPAIQALEAQYGEMWAQDAAAMYGYAGSSATASKVTPFAAPPQTANPAGTASQAAAVTQATSTSAGTQAQLSHLINSVPASLQSLASPIAAASSAPSSSGGLSAIIDAETNGAGFTPLGLLNAYKNNIGAVYSTLGLTYFASGDINKTGGIIANYGRFPGWYGPQEAEAATGALGSLGAGLGGGLGGVSAGLGKAASVGGMSVPGGWTSAGPEVTPMNPEALPAKGISAAAPESGTGSLLGGMPLAGAAGHGGFGGGPKYGFKPTVMARPPFAG